MQPLEMNLSFKMHSLGFFCIFLEITRNLWSLENTAFSRLLHYMDLYLVVEKQHIL